jgi:hypothetical protein
MLWNTQRTLSNLQILFPFIVHQQKWRAGNRINTRNLHSYSLRRVSPYLRHDRIVPRPNMLLVHASSCSLATTWLDCSLFYNAILKINFTQIYERAGLIALLHFHYCTYKTDSLHHWRYSPALATGSCVRTGVYCYWSLTWCILFLQAMLFYYVSNFRINVCRRYENNYALTGRKFQC